MFAAEAAVFIHFQPLGIILFVLHGVVVALFALGTREYDFHSHFSAPPFHLPPCYGEISVFCVQHKKTPLQV
jgi:hypothetical protein